MRSLLVANIYSAYDIEVNIKLLILWQLKEKDLQLIYSPKLEEVQRAQSYYISEEWSIQRKISVNILLSFLLGEDTILFPMINEWNLQRLPGEQASSLSLSKLLHPKSLTGSLCPWTVAEATARNPPILNSQTAKYLLSHLPLPAVLNRT